ncbi:hypothetical protein CBS101457_006531 [Exobasidium rhododendri]|nr:hypothetical protein CBS101457_006531 [Exobasidium rhododendri]
MRSETEEEALSTPPTEDEDDGGFFSLEVDFDLSELTLSSEGQSPATIGDLHQAALPIVGASQATNKTSRPNRRLAPEPDALGNLEYKLRLLPPTRHRYDRLLTQLKWRLLQGGGSCTYELGVLDDGRCIGICSSEMRISLKVLGSMASELGASVRVRRAFILVKSGQSSETDKFHQLRSMGNEEAQMKLSVKAGEMFDFKGEGHCACNAGEEQLTSPEEKMSSRSFLVEALDGSNEYEVDIEGGRENFIGGSWMGATDSDDDRKGSGEGEGGTVENDEEQGLTFSLSLDEMATRQGIGSQRRSPRRRCRYQAKGAQMKRAKEAMTLHQSKLAPLAENEGKLSRDAISSFPGKGSLPSEACLRSCEEDASTSAITCERVIVEAVVSKLDEEDTHDFIDYNSL